MFVLSDMIGYITEIRLLKSSQVYLFERGRRKTVRMSRVYVERRSKIFVFEEAGYYVDTYSTTDIRATTKLHSTQ